MPFPTSRPMDVDRLHAHGPGRRTCLHRARRRRDAAAADVIACRVPRWSPDGRQIAFGANRNITGGIFVIVADGQNERRVTTTGGWPVWWPDGRQIGFLVTGRIGGQEIHLVSRDGGATRHLAEVTYNGGNHPFDVSPDGSRIVTTNAVHVSDEIWLLEPRVRQ